MSNVIQFAPRTKPVETGEGRSTATVQEMPPRAAEQESAAALVMAALNFYARQGYDGGIKARKAMVAMQREVFEPPSQA